MAHRDVRCGLMLRDHIDGIPLDLAATLLPGRTRLSPGLGEPRPPPRARAAAVRRRRERGRVVGLHRRNPAGRAARQPPTDDPGARLEARRDRVGRLRPADELLGRGDPGQGGGSSRPCSGSPVVPSSGTLARTLGASARSPRMLGRRVVAWDVDPAASERHYQRLKAASDTRVLPLVQDLVNPSPGLGWAGSQSAARSSSDRMPTCVLALALVHHLAISNNVPLGWIACVPCAPRSSGHRRVRAEGRPDGPAPPRVAPRCLRELHAGWLRARLRSALQGRSPIAGPGLFACPLHDGAAVSFGERVRLRPVLYPAAILMAFVLNFMSETAVSPYAAGRPLLVAVAVGLALPWLAGLVTGDRDVAGLIAAILILLILAAPVPGAAVPGIRGAGARRRAARHGSAASPGATGMGSTLADDLPHPHRRRVDPPRRSRPQGGSARSGPDRRPRPGRRVPASAVSSGSNRKR